MKSARHPSAEADHLTRLIEERPAAAVHYLLRGEEWLAGGDPGQARDDLTMARDLALRGLHDNPWGYVLQAYIDRADAGLRQCE